MKTSLKPAVGVAAIALGLGGCVTPPYITPAISDLDDNDLKVLVRTNDKSATIEQMMESARQEATKGCGRWDRVPEYMSHIVQQDWWTFGEALAEGLKPVYAQERAPTEKIVQFLFACTDGDAANPVVVGRGIANP